MGFSYIIAAQGATPVVGNVLVSLKTAANIVSRVTEIAVSGESTTTTVNRMAVRRSTTDGVTPTAQTPAKVSSSSPAAQSTAASAFTGSQPVYAAAPALWQYALNTLSDIVRWVPAPGQELLIQGATAGNDEISLTSLSGVGVITGQIIFEEI